MTRQIIFTGTTANDGTGDTLRDGAAKINANFREIYETFGPDGLIIGTQVDFDSATINFIDTTLTFKTNVGAVGPTANRTIRFPDYSALVVLDSATQTLTNKTLDSCSYGVLLINDLSADHQYKVLPSELAANTTITLPVLTNNDTFVFADASQSLKNKSLDSDTISNAIITDTVWVDTNGNGILEFSKVTGSPVNYLQLRNSLTNSPVDITADGTDTDVSIRLLPKGAGAVELSGKVMFGDGQFNTLTADGGALPSSQPAIFLNTTTGTPPHAWTLSDGDEKGEVIYITNISGANNVEITPTNFGQGTKFTLTGGTGSSPTVAHLIWDGSNWYVINKSDVTITV
jgi:hypothetical protein